ncbi:MAG: biopolymer transporter ExbD [Bdellovibrionales bacterium]|nr:biopolymer transporter ExbD [Bdellovibrionales bacterium]
MISTQNGKSKSLDFELNLVPFIDMLSACLCFLLLTAIWTYVGTMNTQQAVGAESTAGKNPPSVVVQLDPDNSVELQLKDVKTDQRKFAIAASGGKIDWKRVEASILSIKNAHPEIKTSVVLTRPNVTYGHTIKMIDSLKSAKITDVGVSPM